ncbi:hypothetical protein [Flavobacterium hauense]
MAKNEKPVKLLVYRNLTDFVCAVLPLLFTDAESNFPLFIKL